MTAAKGRSVLFHLLDVGLNVVVIVGIVVGVRTFLVSPFQVEGSSMSSTLENREYIIINKLAYILGTPERGDIVVFRPPSDHGKFYVKRIIGVPGDTVILRGGDVYVQTPDGAAPVELDEPYLDERNSGRTFAHPGGGGGEERYTVPEGHYFLLGDNRQGSLDSRSFTDSDHVPVPFVVRDDIKGRVWFVALPLSKVHEVVHPRYVL